MLKHPFKKALGLTLLYCVIIIGIFVLQFKNQSVIFKNAGILKMSVAQTQNADGSLTYKNELQVSFKGINFTCDDVHPLTLTDFSKNKNQSLTFISFEQPSDTSFKFNFSENVSLIFSVSDITPKASLNVIAEIPDNSSSLSLFYKPHSGFSVTEQSKTKQLVSSKNISYVMNAREIDESNIIFTKNSPSLSYRKFEISNVFTFASISDDEINAQIQTFEQNIQNYRTSLISNLESSMQDTGVIPETAIAAYVAESAIQGKFNEAVRKVPDSFKKGTRRTYFTSPYFNSLVEMNKSLVMATENLSVLVQNAVASKNADIFTTQGIAQFLLKNQNTQIAQEILSIPQNIENFNPTLSQATGILKTYVYLTKNNSSLANIIQLQNEKCISAITENCNYSQGILTLTENNVPLSFTQAVECGTVLIEVGKLSSNHDIQKGGLMIVNSAFAQNQTFDVRKFAEIYTYLVPENSYYPHLSILDASGDNPVWAWTCSSNIDFSTSPDNKETTINISFLQGESHYLIIRGIKPFDEIEIYGLSFHTDPRFETYNSSGYVYNRETQTLFLKSRQKSATETVKLYYNN